MGGNFYDLIVSRRPRDENSVFAEQADGRRLRYGDLHAAVGQYANVFAERGIKPGALIAVQVRKSLEALIVYLASLRSGAVLLPLNPSYTSAEVEYFLRDAQPTLRQSGDV